MSDSDLVIDLRDTLRGAGCIAVQVAPDMLEVTVSDAPSVRQEAREVRAYLATWMAARGAEAEVVEE